MVYDGFIEEYVEKLKRTLEGNEESINEFITRTKSEKSSPIMIAMDIIRKYSGDLHIFVNALPLDEIKQGYSGNIIGKIVSIRCVDFEKDGKQRRRCIGYLDDDRGKLAFTIFDPSFPYAKGDFIWIKDAEVGEYSDKPYLTLSGRNQITILEKSRNVDASNQLLKIKDLKPDMYAVNIKGNLRLTGTKENTGIEGTTLYSGILSDETGNIGVRSWGIKLEEGLAELNNAYIKQYQERLYLNLGKGASVKIVSRRSESLTTLEQLTELEKGDVSGIGIITRVYSKNPVVDVCSVCGKIIREGKCQKHPDAQINSIIRLSLILDDGTASHLVYAYQKNLESFIAGGKDAIEKGIMEGNLTDIIRQIEEYITFKFAEFKLYGFKGTQGYYLELEEIKILEEDDLKEKYVKMMEEMK